MSFKDLSTVETTYNPQQLNQAMINNQLIIDPQQFNDKLAQIIGAPQIGKESVRLKLLNSLEDDILNCIYQLQQKENSNNYLLINLGDKSKRRSIILAKDNFKVRLSKLGSARQEISYKQFELLKNVIQKKMEMMQKLKEISLQFGREFVKFQKTSKMLDAEIADLKQQLNSKKIKQSEMEK